MKDALWLSCLKTKKDIRILRSGNIGKEFGMRLDKLALLPFKKKRKRSNVTFEPQVSAGATRPAETDLFSTVASLKQGPCGTDQWYPSEIKSLPFSVLRVFWDLTERWELTFTTPTTLQEIRQVNIPKPHKDSPQSFIQCADLRPISVCSIWWRLYTSTWSKSQSLRRWRAQQIPPAIAGGKNMPGAEDLAAELYVNFNTVGTMDYSMCFDHVCPKLCTQVMNWLSIPEALTKTFCYN